MSTRNGPAAVLMAPPLGTCSLQPGELLRSSVASSFPQRTQKRCLNTLQRHLPLTYPFYSNQLQSACPTGCVSRDALPSSGQMWAAQLRVQIGFHLHKLNPKNTGRDGKRSEEERGGKKQGRGCEERGREERGNMNMSSKVNFREMRQINRKLTSCKYRVQNFISSSQETTGRF